MPDKPIIRSAFGRLDGQRVHDIREKLRELVQETQATFPPGRGTPEMIRELLMQFTRMALDEAYPNVVSPEDDQTPP